MYSLNCANFIHNFNFYEWKNLHLSDETRAFHEKFYTWGSDSEWIHLVLMCYVPNYVHKFHLSWPRVLKNDTLKTNVPNWLYIFCPHACSFANFWMILRGCILIWWTLYIFVRLHPYLLNFVTFVRLHPYLVWISYGCHSSSIVTSELYCYISPIPVHMVFACKKLSLLGVL